MSFILTNKVETIVSITKIINAITVDDILKVSKEVFTNEKLNMVLFGPFDDKEQKKIVKSLKI